MSGFVIPFTFNPFFGAGNYGWLTSNDTTSDDFRSFDDVLFDTSGNYYFIGSRDSGTLDLRISKFDHSLTFVTGTQTTNSYSSNPLYYEHNACFDSSGNILVLDKNRITKFDPSLSILWGYSIDNLVQGCGIHSDASDNVYVTYTKLVGSNNVSGVLKLNSSGVLQAGRRPSTVSNGHFLRGSIKVAGYTYYVGIENGNAEGTLSTDFIKEIPDAIASIKTINVGVATNCLGLAIAVSDTGKIAYLYKDNTIYYLSVYDSSFTCLNRYYGTASGLSYAKIYFDKLEDVYVLAETDHHSLIKLGRVSGNSYTRQLTLNSSNTLYIQNISFTSLNEMVIFGFISGGREFLVKLPNDGSYLGNYTNSNGDIFNYAAGGISMIATSTANIALSSETNSSLSDTFTATAGSTTSNSLTELFKAIP